MSNTNTTFSSRPSTAIDRSALPVRTSSINHLRSASQAGHSRTTSSRPISPPPPKPSMEDSAIPPIPQTPPPPSQPLPAPPKTAPGRNHSSSNATLTSPTRHRRGTSSPPFPPPPARSTGTSRRPPTSPAATRSLPQPPPPTCTPSTRTPEDLMRMIRERSRDSYIRIRERPSVPELSLANARKAGYPRSNSTRSAPTGNHGVGLSISSTSYSSKGGVFHAVAAAPVVPMVPTAFRGGAAPEAGCFPGKKFGVEGFMEAGDGTGPRWDMSAEGAAAHEHRTARTSGYLEDLRIRIRQLLRGFHFSVSIGFGAKEREKAEVPRSARAEMTIRIKNSAAGTCVFDVLSDENMAPLENLRELFPYSKSLQKSLHEWNLHYQNPPPHWVVNFVPRAYLRRGYFLAEEVCDYLTTYPDGCRYRIEYEPIGHQTCHVGTVVPRPRRNKKTGELWEGREKF